MHFLQINRRDVPNNVMPLVQRALACEFMLRKLFKVKKM